jgi:hypothetical protein
MSAKFKPGQHVRVDWEHPFSRDAIVLEVVFGFGYKGYRITGSCSDDGLVSEYRLISMDEYEDIARRDQESADRDKPPGACF